jgi:uncharacterized protein (TIGR00251 family)
VLWATVDGTLGRYAELRRSFGQVWLAVHAGDRSEGADGEGMITVSVRVHPGASREGVTLIADGSLDVRLRARAVEGQANAGLIALLATRLDLRRRDVEIVSGLRSRQKTVRIALATAGELRQRLGEEATSC